MSASEQNIGISSHAFTIHGDANDPYFVNATTVLAALAPLEAWARANLAPDAVVIDAGGNIGLTALLLSTLVPQGHVHVFEALPANATFLRRNIECNGIGNCTVNAVALGEHAGMISMAGAGSSSHVVLNDRADIPMVTLDGYMNDAGLTRVDFIKMDVEGFEPAVLEGAARMIERFQPPILMEFNTWCLAYVQDFDARDFATQLWRAFEVASVTGTGAEHPAGGGELRRFFHDNVVLHGTVEDVLLRPKPGIRLRRARALPAGPDEPRPVPELQRLQALLAAMEDSTSWRITAPVRALGRMLKQRGAGARRDRTSSNR